MCAQETDLLLGDRDVLEEIAPKVWSGSNFNGPAIH
jgi:hypothetical protein